MNERYKSKKRCFEDTRDHHAPIESRIAPNKRARVQIELLKKLATLAGCPPREMRVSPERQKSPFRRKIASRVTFHERLYSASKRTTRSPIRGRFALHKNSRAQRTVFYK